jgi:hypothetical protein
MQPLALGAAALAWGCFRKMGQKKEKDMYLIVKWNRYLKTFLPIERGALIGVC